MASALTRVLMTWACHGRVKDTGQGHGRVPGRVKTHVADDMESNALAPAEGTASVESEPNTPPLPLPLIPQYAPVAPQGAGIIRREKPLVDKIQKQGAEEFRSNIDDDPEKAKFWLENTIRVFDELSCTSEESKNRQNATSRAQTTSVASINSARPNRPECSQCGRCHFNECRVKERGCFKCESLDHFIRDCPELEKGEKKQEVKGSSVPLMGRPQKNPGSGATSKITPRDDAMRSEGRAPARTYAIHTCEETESPDVITGTFSIHDIFVVALTDPSPLKHELSNEQTILQDGWESVRYLFGMFES
ncbi:Gag-Pol polyprotein [Gossypium arboreum]|uniref:Gag-Pol polyprotein n=1 Tax=Gossypium arboreum TaxID=29729 RepID=A0A0B0NCV8_GOSAR|nr:Gag-Pol polyprotein [Gossypium arboreum]